MKGIVGSGIFANKFFLLVAVPITAWIITNMWSNVSALANNPGYQTTYSFLKQLVLILTGGQHLVFTSVYSLQAATETQQILYHTQLIIGGTFMTAVLIYILWTVIKGTAAGSYQSWNIFAKAVMVFTVFGAIGIVGTIATYLSTGNLFMPFHGWFELSKYTSQLGWEFTRWLLTGIG